MKKTNGLCNPLYDIVMTNLQLTLEFLSGSEFLGSSHMLIFGVHVCIM